MTPTDSSAGAIDVAGQGVGREQEDAAAQQRGRDQSRLSGPSIAAQHLGHDQAHEADRPREGDHAAGSAGRRPRTRGA